MNNMPDPLRRQLSKEAEYSRCCLLGYHKCGGRITWEHVFTYASKQIQERWNIIPLCARGHGVDEWQDSGSLNKEANQWVALNRATDDEILGITRAVDYFKLKRFLNDKYGEYIAPTMKPAHRWVMDIAF